MESTGALMVSGEWGCGKTYYIEKVGNLVSSVHLAHFSAK